jgi:MoaA/NifB/PqqE/SkfB family radical SAM enzyme
MTHALVLRREPFGGIITKLDGDDQKMVFLNHTGFQITRHIAKGLNDNEILEEIKSLYEVSDIEVVKNDIQTHRSMISNIESDNDDLDSNIDDFDNSDINGENFSLPALSAPLDLYWEITSRCNLFCRHCYNRSSAVGYEPDLKQILSVIDELKSTKLRGIAISGGEPLMRKDIKTILEHVRPLALDINLSTNGTLITDKNSAWFPDLISGANLSLDIGNKEGYEQFRGKKGSFDKCIRGLRLLIKRDIPVVIQTVISRFNVDRLDELANLLIAEGATSWVVRIPFASGRAIENKYDFLNREEIMKKESIFSDILNRYRSKFEMLAIGVNFGWTYREPYRCTQREDQIMSCAAGTVLASLSADGRMAPCPVFADTNFKSDIVWNNNFLDQWVNAKCMKAMRSIKISHIPLCFQCADYGKICHTAGCRAKSCLNGNLYTPDPDCGYFLHI